MKKSEKIIMKNLNELTRKEAIEYLQIPEKHFDNFFKNSGEIKSFKKGSRWCFLKTDLDFWKSLREERTITLSLKEYETCFEFAIKMVYGGLSLNGIRGQRTEVQGADDVILGILAEHAIKKFLDIKFNTIIELDEEVHPENITPQDFNLIKVGNTSRIPNVGVGVKGSKWKSSFLILTPIEFETQGRKSDVYIFARVGLPSDHLFRILRDHSFFARVRKFLDENDKFKKIDELKEIPVWICGFTYSEELERVTEIPGQKFTGKKAKEGEEEEPGYRYVKSVKGMHNSNEEWNDLIKKL